MIEAITVSKLNTYIKQIFDSEELLHNIAVVGEIFGISSSRNVYYFNLKDENASLSCVSFYPNLFLDIKEGDKVIAAKYSGTDIKIDGDEYTILHQSDILAIVE